MYKHKCNHSIGRLYCKNAQNSRKMKKKLKDIDEHILIDYNKNNKSDIKAQM